MCLHEYDDADATLNEILDIDPNHAGAIKAKDILESRRRE